VKGQDSGERHSCSQFTRLVRGMLQAIGMRLPFFVLRAPWNDTLFA